MQDFIEACVCQQVVKGNDPWIQLFFKVILFQ